MNGGESIFSLDRYDVLHVEAIERTEDLRLVTDARQWAHAVEFKTALPLGWADGPTTVTVTLDVEVGKVGVGALNIRGSSMLCEAWADRGRHVVTLQIPLVTRCRGIVVRNADNRPSAVRILAIHAGRTTAEDQASPSGFDLQAPYGSTLRGFSEKNIFADQRKLAGRDAGVIFDVGAHLGDGASIYLEVFPRAIVHCFEPTPATFQRLRTRFGDSSRTVLHPVALGESHATAILYANPVDETNSLLPFADEARQYLASDALRPSQSIQVPCSTIDGIADAHGIRRIDVLNLDVQGAELAVLRGASTMLREKRIGVIVSEMIWVNIYDGQIEAHALLGFLKTQGYAVYDFYNFAYAESGQLLWGDAVFTADVVART